MADSETKLKKKNKNKRKNLQRHDEVFERPSKTLRIDISQEEQEPEELEKAENSGHSRLVEELNDPWTNLELILLIQDKELGLQKKVESVFDFVKLRMKERGNETNEDSETVRMLRLIVFLSDWIQSLLISSEKKARGDGGNFQDLVFEPCLDYRCWDIFKFCLEESLEFHVSLNFSRNLLRALCFIARNALSQLGSTSSNSKELFFTGGRLNWYNIVLDCVSLVFSSHGGLSNDNLDLWLSTVNAVLEFVLKIFSDDPVSGDAGDFAMRFSCLVLEPFAKFLSIHPTKKNGFHDFVDKVMEFLLHLLGMFHHKTDGSNLDGTRNLLKLIEEVIYHGLFHQVHIDGFLCLNATGKYVTTNDGKPKDSKTFIKSYHRHLFEKLERIVAEKKLWPMCAIGDLFCLLVERVKKLKGASTMPESTSGDISRVLSESTSALLEKKHYSISLNIETRKLLFDFFVQIMEPLLEIVGYIKVKGEGGPSLLDAYCLLKSINSLLGSFMSEKVYVRTEDNSEGACLNFLKKVYATIMLFSSNVLALSKYEIENSAHQKVWILVANEVLTSVGYFMEIEYEVIGNDVVRLWLMILSYLAVGHYFADVPAQSSLSSKISDLGCQLIDLYSQLRQVKSAIFALCKAIRMITPHESKGEGEGEGEMDYHKYMPSSCNEGFGKSVGMLLCLREFKLAIHKASKAIPEGQASGLIRQLTEDISESMKWMEISGSGSGGKEFDKLNGRNVLQNFGLQAELLGRGLSEMYALVLESLPVTTGNSHQLGTSIEELVSLLRPCMGSLVAGKDVYYVVGGDENKLMDFGVYSHWIFFFFFRLYMSCRSLCRQVISLMPPDSSKRMSSMMGDSLTACSAREWMQRTDWIDEGYFTWVIQPSASVLSLLQSVSSIYLRDSSIDYSPLIYVLHAMALQRLGDLNRQIKSLEYLKQSIDNMMQIEVGDTDGLSVLRKRSKKCGNLLSVLGQEATGLTDFILDHLSLVAKNELSIPTRAIHGSDSWDLGVSAVNKKSLVTAIWWIICQNIDVWTLHAAKKKLKMFLSFLIHTSLPYITSCDPEVGMQNINEYNQLKKVTLQHISSALLSDPTLYEQRFVCRCFASRFCHALELLFEFSSSNNDLSSLPDWKEVLTILDNSTMVASRKDAQYDSSSQKKLTAHSSDMFHKNDCKRKKAFPLTNVKLTACQHLLHLLRRIPKRNISSRSLSLYMTYILNLERFVVGILLDNQSTLCSPNKCELFKMFLSCRKTLKYLITASFEDTIEGAQSSFAPILSKDPFPVLWLSKSLYMVVGLQKASFEDSASEIEDMIFSLMDYTSYMFLTLSKYQFNHALCSLVNDENFCTKLPYPCVADEPNTSELSLDSSHSTEGLKNMVLVSNTLKEQTESLLSSLVMDCNERGVRALINADNANKFSSLASCFNGFLWGLATAMSHIDASNGGLQVHLTKLKYLPVSQLDLCVNSFAKLSNLFLHMLVNKDDQLYINFCASGYNTDCLGAQQFFSNCSSFDADISFSKQQQISGNTSIDRKTPKLGKTDGAATVLSDGYSFELQSLNGQFLQGLLKGEYPEAAFSLRLLFITSSAMLKLNLEINNAPLLSSSVPILIGISRILLLESVSMDQVSQTFSFVWFDGILKYLEELGRYFPLTDPMASRNLYVELIGLHLRTMGKCICIQGKRATLASHETESTTKTLHGYVGLSASSTSPGLYCLDELKSRLRMSFKVFVKKASELHFLSAIQAIERALFGVQEGGSVIYGVHTGSEKGGKISSAVAGGVECLDLILEFVSGRKRLGVVKRHIQSLIAGLFSIILHLRSPLIFYGKRIQDKGDNDPDPGSVILMCVEVLIRISGKHSLFKMDVWQIAQCLRIPESLFQDFYKLKLSEVPVLSELSLFSDHRKSGQVASTNFVIDRQFLIDLFSASCRLLYNVLKHHKSECERCISLLEASVRVLLHSLERVDIDAVSTEGYFSWEVEEGVRCACFLRRIYEEIRQQKDSIGRHCSQFLADYIWVYSGYGPLKSGIKRDIDEALRPGIYALMETCSADDLQYLHTSFGEGPCRNTLATLQHDYKQNFQYGGKV